MSIVCVTSNQTEFATWMEQYAAGDLHALPLYDPLHYFEALVTAWQVESLSTVQEGIVPGKYLVALRDSSFFPTRFFAAKMLRAQVVEVDALEDIPPFLEANRPEHVLLLIDPAQISHAFYRFYWMQLMKRCPVGLITAKSLAHLSWLLVKSRLQPEAEGELTLLPRSNKTYRGTPKGRIVTAADDMFEASQQILTAEFLETFAVSTHGTEDVISLKDSIVCGKSKLQHPAGMTCELGVNCPVGERGVTPDEIRARIAIINTCMGLRLNESMLPPEASLAMTFLENHAAVYISSNMVKYGPDAEVCLLQNLLKHGYSAGQATRMTNLWLEQTGIDFPCFSVIGDPEMRRSRVQAHGTEHEWVSENEVHVRLQGQSLLEIELSREQAEQYQHVQVRTKSELFYAIITDAEAQTSSLFLFAWEPISEESLKISLHAKQELQFPRGTFSTRNWLLSLQRHVTGKKVHAQVPTIHNQLDRLAAKMADLEYDATAYFRVSEEMRKLQEAVLRIQKEILDSVLPRATTDSSIWMPDVYLESARIGADLTSEVSCFVCGSASMRVSFEHRVTGERREMVYCPRCGGISDVPESPLVHMEIKGSHSAWHDETLEHTLVLENHAPVAIQGYAGLRLDSVKRYDVPVDPDLIVYELLPGERKEYTFTFQLNPAVKTHLYYAKAFLMHEFDLYYANKPLFIAGGAR